MSEAVTGSTAQVHLNASNCIIAASLVDVESSSHRHPTSEHINIDSYIDSENTARHAYSRE